MPAHCPKAICAILLCGAIAAGGAQAQVSVTSASFGYTQDFNALTPSAWSNDSTLPGWFLFRQPAPGTAITSIGSDSGSSNAGNFYSYGSSAGERALGGAGSGGAYFGSPGTGSIAGWIAVGFTNNSGATLNGFTAGFDGEQWRNGGNTAAQPMVLEYGFGASFTAVSSWIQPGGNFDWASPVATVTAAAVDGNAAGRVTARGGAISTTWAPGDTLWIRWVERNDTGSDHGLAIDNFSLSVGGGGGGGAAIIPVCPTALSVATGVSVGFALSASDADSMVNAATIFSGGASGISLGNFVAAPGTGGKATVSLDVGAALAAGSYPVVVQFANGDGQTASCTVTLTVAALPGSYTPIYDIQGSGTTSSYAGTTVTTRGVVTKINNNGYFLQDPVGDGNSATSDGIFVFTSSPPYVSAGQLLQITGPVSEFNTGAATNSITLANPVTEFSFPSTIYAGTGTVTPTVITLPVATAGGLERYEGMLLTINTPLVASQNYFQGRYGQVTLAANARLAKPTDVHRPGVQAQSLQDQNARSSIMLDDGASSQNPNPTPYFAPDNTLRAGDTLAAGLTGVIDYGLATNSNTGAAMYRIHPTVTPSFTRTNARTAAPAAVGGNVKVASFNVLNFFTTFTDGATAGGGSGQGCAPSNNTGDCRGADSAAEFARQRTKIVEAMAAIGADVFGLMEIQNNGNTAAQNLVDALNAKLGQNTYAVVPPPPATGTDAIRVAMVYKPAVLTLSGAPMSDASAIHNRPPMAQAFTNAGGQKFSVVVNHFKSKSCSGASGADADQNDGQGCYNERRKQQAQALLTFIGTVKTAAADDDVLVIGDINAYTQEDPIDILVNGGLVNQVTRFSPGDYSYVFDGEIGSLDHALATASLNSQAAGAALWHINADEPSVIDYNVEFKQPICSSCGPDYYSATPYRSSDHDPVVIGLNLGSNLLLQTINFPTPATQVAGATVNLAATASSGLGVGFASLTPAVCTVSGMLASMSAAGTCTVVANQSGNAQYQPAPQVQVSFTVTLAAQSISFASPGDRLLSAGAFSAPASATSGLAVTLVSLTPAICSVSAQTVTPLATGSCAVRADQAGNAAYAEATSVILSFAILGAPPPTPTDEGDVPLPPWSLALLGLVLAAGLRRRRA